MVILETDFVKLMSVFREEFKDIEKNLLEPCDLKSKEEFFLRYFEGAKKAGNSHLTVKMGKYERLLVATIVPEDLRHLLFRDETHHIGSRRLSKLFFESFKSEYLRNVCACGMRRSIITKID
jgi:hypothetical protein